MRPAHPWGGGGIGGGKSGLRLCGSRSARTGPSSSLGDAVALDFLRGVADFFGQRLDDRRDRGRGIGEAHMAAVDLDLPVAFVRKYARAGDRADAVVLRPELEGRNFGTTRGVEIERGVIAREQGRTVGE